MSHVLVLVDDGTSADIGLLKEVGAHVDRAVVSTPPAVWTATDVYVGTSGGGRAAKLLGRAGRSAERVLHRAPVIDLLPRTAMPGTPSEPKHWLSSGLAQVTSILKRHPDTDIVVVEGPRAELLGWHLVRRQPTLVVVAGCAPAARMVFAGPPSGDVSLVAALIREPQALYRSVPDSRSVPTVAVAVDGDDMPPLTGDDVRVTIAEGEKACVTLDPAGGGVLLRRPAPTDADAELLVLAGRSAVSDPGADVATTRLLVGPANYSGQASAWVRCLSGIDGLDARNVAVVATGSPFDFPADVRVSTWEWPDAAVRARLAAREIVPATHVFAEAMRPIAALGAEGAVHPSSVSTGARELELLVASGRRVGVVLHGSEARTPSAHQALYPFSPFNEEGHDREWATRRTQTETVHGALGRIDVARFVTTPDMLDFVPGATWLPLVLSAASFRLGRPLFAGPRPVVLHAPSSGVLKGSDRIDAVLRELEAEGLLTYRRLTGVPSYELPAHIRAADVVVDQVVMGNSGVLATQALAAGRVVVAHLLPHVRERYGVPVPVVEANPETLREVMLRVVGDRTTSAEIASTGPAFARMFHDGARARTVLEDFLRG